VTTHLRLGKSLSIALALVVLASCGRGGFSGHRALKHASRLCDFGPRYVGSEGHDRAADYIARTLEQYDWQVTSQEFAYGGERLRNIIATRGSGPIILLGTHYDTRPQAENDAVEPTLPVPGANDGASGVGVLLEVARSLDREATADHQVMLAFLDGEDHGDIDGWEWAVGAGYLARALAGNPDTHPEWTLILDMVGDVNQEFFYEWSSSVALNERVWATARSLGYGGSFIARPKHHVIADQTPFVELGMTASLLIDLDYPYWHTRQDTLDKISADSLQRVGDVIMALLSASET